MAKVLVTGATGFIGNYVIEQLLAAKHEVIASASSCAKAINTAWYQNVTFIELDFNKLNENENYFKYFQSPDKLIHLAWEGLHNYKGEYHISQNLPRHYWLIQNLVQNGLNDISITGTCFEYGLQEGKLSEQTPAIPSNAYATAKHLLREKLTELFNSYPTVSFKWLRLFYMYGMGQSPSSLIPQLEKALANHDPVLIRKSTR